MNTVIPIRNIKGQLLSTAGFISSLSLAAVTLGTFAIAFLTPPISGPFAVGETVKYPYTDIISRFPRDYYWMYPAMLLMLILIVFMVCVDSYAKGIRKIFSRVAVLFACLGAGVIFIDYFIQVSVIQPSLLKGEMDGIALLTQYNPHGIFIALEEAGYILISLACLFSAFVLAEKGSVQNALRWISILGFVLTLVSLILISALFGLGREYIFEIAVISIDFIVLILLGILWSILFKRGRKNTHKKA